MKPRESKVASKQSPLSGDASKTAILEQLVRIQESKAFSGSPRAKEFLSYVVEHGLEGHTELLKERLIGVNLFHRSPTYITSDDPIVRVEEHRRRQGCHRQYGARHAAARRHGR